MPAYVYDIIVILDGEDSYIKTFLDSEKEAESFIKILEKEGKEYLHKQEIIPIVLL